ncbi:D-2-hydroxyacid dehydrogenase family protein [Enterovirga aerilata]|uniref:D-2-hydroxyacid dehydrogenase family protein n=1 Tax=Enterovirga aerilata TaxID=2730920 RepID=A0A849I6M7_9HYPH|nr:D-2-hydroxyacid dehydrogenase family protein [Enterovirga sp. DB1703]NNM73038.1 D-2-hydroxyacid dehydrogenase family protein [Enterovirga sp. DB1703]
MRIAVLDDYQDAFRRHPNFQALAAHEVTAFTDTVKDPDELAARLAPFDAIVLIQQRSPLPDAVISRLSNLKFISQTGRNTYHLDLAACRRQGVTVSAGGAGDPSVTAELTWGLVLAALRHIPEEVGNLKAGRWQSTLGTRLRGKILGIYGFGRIGSIVAGYGRAFGMRVLCFGREGSLARAREAGYEVPSSRAAFFSVCDVICLHVLLTPETRGVITAADLAHMKPDALLVNTSRAPIIEEGALAAALLAGRPGRAAVDVFDDEPVLGASDPLIGMPNALCTPHLGYVARETYEALFGTAIDQILAFETGAPINLVELPAPR